jgi:hypothetical protein
MSVTYSPLSRRMFLRAASGATLALPTLASLLPRQVAAQTVAPRRIMFLTIEHFTPAQQWMDPAVATAPVGSDGAKQAVLSTMSNPFLPVLGHTLYDSLRTRGLLTLLYGLDNMVDTAGHGHLGPSTLSGSLEYDQDIYYPAGLWPSIDTVMESSPTLYPASTPAGTVKVLRSVTSANFESPFNPSCVRSAGKVTSVPGFTNPVQLFNSVFSALSAAPGDAGVSDAGTMAADRSPSLKKAVLNNVYAAYVDARNNRRISAADKERLEDHLQMISDLQNQLRASTTTDGGSSNKPSVDCTKPAAPGTTLTYAEIVQMCFKLSALAMRCGLTKVGVLSGAGHNNIGLPGLPATGYHNGVVHSSLPPDQKSAYYVVYAKFHLDAMADNFLSLLDVEEAGTGRTYLDNMLTVFTHEHGLVTPAQNDGHPNRGHMVALFGSMGGVLRPDRVVVMPKKNGGALPYNAMLITYLQAMGIPKSEYEATNGGPGYGPYTPAGSSTIPSPYATSWASRLYGPVSEIMT